MPKKLPQRRANYQLTPEKFAELWETSASAQEAANRMLIPLSVAYGCVTAYRKQGIHLKRMPLETTDNVDVEGLNELIDKLDERERKKRQPPTGE